MSRDYDLEIFGGAAGGGKTGAMKREVKANHQQANQSSGAVEYYSPGAIVEIARAIMGGIDIDPASSAAANEIVKAHTFLTAPAFSTVTGFIGIEHLPIRRYESWGGLAQQWAGRLWLNPPFGQPQRGCSYGTCKKQRCANRGYHIINDQPGIDHWIDAAIAQYRAGDITAGFILCFASVNAGWFQPLKAFPRLEFSRRVNYLNPETLKPIQGVTRDSVLVVLPPKWQPAKTSIGQLAELGAKMGSVNEPWPSQRGYNDE